MLEEADYRAYDTFLITKARMYVGNSGCRSPLRRGGHWQRKSKSEIRRMMKIPIARSYSRHQRVRWARDMIVYPREDEALRATMLKDCPRDTSSPMINNQLTENAPPWLLVLQEDLREIMGQRY